MLDLTNGAIYRKMVETGEQIYQFYMFSTNLVSVGSLLQDLHQHL